VVAERSASSCPGDPDADKTPFDRTTNKHRLALLRCKRQNDLGVHRLWDNQLLRSRRAIAPAAGERFSTCISPSLLRENEFPLANTFVNWFFVNEHDKEQ